LTKTGAVTSKSV